MDNSTLVMIYTPTRADDTELQDALKLEEQLKAEVIIQDLLFDLREDHE